MIFLLALVALLAFNAGFLAGALWAGADHRAFNARTVGTLGDNDGITLAASTYARRDEWPGS